MSHDILCKFISFNASRIDDIDLPPAPRSAFYWYGTPQEGDFGTGWPEAKSAQPSCSGQTEAPQAFPEVAEGNQLDWDMQVEEREEWLGGTLAVLRNAVATAAAAVDAVASLDGD